MTRPSIELTFEMLGERMGPLNDAVSDYIKASDEDARQRAVGLVLMRACELSGAYGVLAAHGAFGNGSADARGHADLDVE